MNRTAAKGTMMKRHAVAVSSALALWSVLAGTAAEPALAAEGLSRGHTLLLQHGLQLQASCPRTPVIFDLANWKASNFTTVFLWGSGQTCVQIGNIPWADSLPECDDIPRDWHPKLPSLVCFQQGDEQDVVSPTRRTELSARMASFRNKHPNVIQYTNQFGSQAGASPLQAYMKDCRPDMLCFDYYPFDGKAILPGGSPTALYKYLEEYRKCGLAGNDGTGAQPIPVAFWTNSFRAESEARLNSFSGWAFGCKVMLLFTYTGGGLFSDDRNTAKPTPCFYQLAETNRQSRNLGPSLVRLISTDVRMKMGIHREKNAAGGLSDVRNALPDGVRQWNATASPYLKDVAATNLGRKNNALAGDVILGFFKPLDSSFTNAGHANDTYFMIANGLSDATGTAADCRQKIHLAFDFGTSGITNLLRCSRDTGKIETVNLVHAGAGSRYSLDLHLDGGTGDLLKFNNGGLFVTKSPR
jgi:hypothetical protein